MTLSFKEVDQVLRIIEEFDASEVRFEYGDLKLHVLRSGGRQAFSPSAVAAAQAPVPIKAVAAAAPAAIAAAAPHAAAAAASQAPVQPADMPPGCISVDAPMMGVFYAAPSPEAPPFVTVGQKVDESTDLCIIEVMKVMNNIKAPCCGTIERIIPRNGAMVELGSAVFWIRPD